MKRKEVIFLLAMLLVGTSVGGFAYPSNCYAATAETESSSEQSIYSLANHYFKIKSISNGKYLLGNKAGYEAQADTADSGMTFYFKASDLGEYILFDQDSKYLTYNTFNAIVRNTTLSDKTRFKVEQYEDNSFSFYSYVKKKYVGIKGTSLVWKDNVDDTCRFELELTEGNNPFPEADINIDFYDGDGNPITTSNVMARPSSGENIIGTADTHAHLCHNKGSGEVVFNGDAFSPLGIADALNDCTDLHTLDILWEEKYPGIICSHTRILDMFNPEDEAWEQLDIPRMIKIYQLGGIISPMMWETTTGHQRCATDYLEYMIELSNNSETPTTGILDNQNYFKYDGPYEVPTTWYNMNDDESDDMILGIPYGSDVNGACMLPNFDKVQESFDTVDYDTFTDLYPGIYADGVTAKVNKQTTGNVTFDVNGDRGVAHYGLVPDFWKKMSTNSNIVDINATFNSAEAYIRMIERAEKYSDTYPSRDESQWITTSTEYWH